MDADGLTESERRYFEAGACAVDAMRGNDVGAVGLADGQRHYQMVTLVVVIFILPCISLAETVPEGILADRKGIGSMEV